MIKLSEYWREVLIVHNQQVLRAYFDPPSDIPSTNCLLWDMLNCIRAQIPYVYPISVLNCILLS